MNKLPEIKPDISTGSSKKDPTNVIFYGPPGTGKTYKTKEHAIKVCRGDGNYLRGRETVDFQDLLKNGQVEFTTFHQSYDYAVFVVGFKPETKGDTMVFKPKPGLLLRLAKRARENPSIQFLLIMDEVNRGNISKIFGELITLIEADKRTDGDFPLNVTLPCSCPDYLGGENHDQFSLPSNVHFLGTMNTADRSIALLDTALRRRFHFEEMAPKPTLLSENYDGINLRNLLKKLNRALRDKLTRDHQIGHAWLPIGEKNEVVKNANDIAEIFDQKIIPIIDEWFYDDSEAKTEILKDITKSDNKDSERIVADIDKLKSYSKE
jgi:5-methylcytosine-specific restriction endonuclease McrBC GTP-binding regulatory subunit McrB